MKWISSGLCLLFFAMTANAEAPPSPRQSHPFAWMYGLPVGEQPGWSKSNWFNFETSLSNVWNAPLVMYDNRNNNKLEFSADYEQLHSVLTFGRALNEWFAAAVDIPFLYRSGGMTDDFIDDYHVLIGNRRFNRQFYPENQNTFSVKTNDVEAVNQNNPGNGISNINLKLKAWIWQWLGGTDGTCSCGFAMSSLTKFPLASASHGGTTGNIDQSVLLHLGIPLFSQSAFWLTAGYTWLGENPIIKDWPTYDHSILYEASFDIGVTDNWSLTFNARAESPFLDRHKLSYYDTSTNPQVVSRNRAASGWAGLVLWRGLETFGVRYKTKAGDSIGFTMSEDWGIGSYDTPDGVYTNDSPDVSFTIQTQYNW